MKILCTSDIHRNPVIVDNILKTLDDENIDVFINAGDFLDNNFAYDFFRKLKVRSFIVPGNWDSGLSFESKTVSVDSFGLFKHEGYSFLCIGGGLPFEVKDLLKVVSDIESEKLIFITHYPPYGILDNAWSNIHAGYPGYRDFILKKSPCMHIFGHIHESNGFAKVGSTLAVNSALADYGDGRGYIVDLPGKKIKVVSLNEKKRNTPFKVQSTISRLVGKRKQDLS